MTVDVSKLIITEVAQITAFNNAGELEFIMDEVQNGSIQNNQEKADITGRNGRKIASLKKNKAVTVSATNGVLVGGALAAQTGTDVEQGTFRVRITDVMTVKNNTCKTSKTAVGVTGAEIGSVYVKNANGSLAQSLSRMLLPQKAPSSMIRLHRKLPFPEWPTAPSLWHFMMWKRKLLRSPMILRSTARY